MKKGSVIISALIGTAIITFSCAQKTEEAKTPWEKKKKIQMMSIKDTINQLYKLHVIECAPKDIAIAESLLDAVDGLEYIDPNKDIKKKVFINKIDQIKYLNKARKHVSIAKSKVYSDIDKDGIPCYQEIEQGTNPFVPESEKLAKTEEEKTKKTKKPVKIGKIEEPVEGFQPLKLHARIHFEFNKHQIKKEYLPYLNVITKYLKTKKNLKVKIVGYTDAVGSKSYNDKLAYKRAEAVKDYLVKHGISPDRIEIVGKGKESYIVDNKTWLNRFTNRRADFFVMEVPQ
ncbi:OmpA family protein [Persephonella sp.]